MKRFVIALVAFAAASAFAAPAALAGTGNGFPSGPHFNLNIHGVANGQGFNGNNQNDIFVPLGSNGAPARCNINLVQSLTYDFQVLQPNCVNNPPASFELPAPCAIDPTSGLCTSTTTIYSVYARALGKPGGQATVTPCFTDPTTGTTLCSTGNYVAVRGTGKSKVDNVTSQLLFISGQCVKGNTVTPIFADPNLSYLWQYDNQGLRLLQLRFYQVPSPVPTGTTC
jgi:hypothetical protein